MARKRALVVDDSKSARVILSRMLEKYDIEVDMGNLRAGHRISEELPSGRDFHGPSDAGHGWLQAVQAIKGNPQTAMIRS